MRPAPTSCARDRGWPRRAPPPGGALAGGLVRGRAEGRAQGRRARAGGRPDLRRSRRLGWEPDGCRHRAAGCSRLGRSPISAARGRPAPWPGVRPRLLPGYGRPDAPSSIKFGRPATRMFRGSPRSVPSRRVPGVHRPRRHLGPSALLCGVRRQRLLRGLEQPARVVGVVRRARGGGSRHAPRLSVPAMVHPGRGACRPRRPHRRRSGRRRSCSAGTFDGTRRRPPRRSAF